MVKNIDMGASRDEKDTKRTAMLLAEAMDRFQHLFIETAGARLGSGRTIDYDEWYSRKQAAHALRESAGDIADQLEVRVPDSVIDSPKFRRSPTYRFYIASRTGLARQFSAVDVMHLANKLLWVAEDQEDADLAAATAEHANELGQYALFLLQVAPTLRNDAASFQKMEVLVSSLQES